MQIAQSPWQLTIQEDGLKSLWKSSIKSLEAVKTKIDKLQELPKEERESAGNQALLNELRSKCIEIGNARYKICVDLKAVSKNKELALAVTKQRLQEQKGKHPWNQNGTWNHQIEVPNEPDV